MKMTTLSGKKLEILASFFPKLEKLTTKEIEKKTGYSHGTVFKNLKELTKENYLKEEKIGKNNLYKLTAKEDLFFIYNFYMRERRKNLQKKHPLLYKRLKEFTEKIDARAVVLFGSYAKSEATEKSDVDILCVSTKTDIEQIASSFKTKYNLLIKPVVIEPDDFKNIKKENETFYEDLIEHGIVLDGLEYYFREVYRNEID